MINICQRISSSETFQTFILWIILLTALSMGLEAVPSIEAFYGEWFGLFFYVTQAIFGFEILVRVVAFAPNFRRFFNEFWNTFDFVVVVLSFIPGPGALAPVARLLRVLRLLRVFSVSDRLRGFLDRIGQSLDELLCALMIVAVWGYIFTISGNYLFFEIDPERWGSLGRSMLSVFYLMLLQDIPVFVEHVIKSSAFNILYFLCFYAVFVSFAFNLIAVISFELNNSKTKERPHD